MALSVLSIYESQFGLYDSISEKFIMMGSSQEMYKLKHEIEEAEQQKDNKEYFEDLIQKYIKMLDSIKFIEDKKPSFIQKKIEIFQQLLDNE